MENMNACIVCKSKAVTHGHIKNGNPDIGHDKIKNTIKIVEIVVTIKDRLKKTEINKRTKNVSLAKKLAKSNRSSAQIIPIVVMWDGLVTNYYKKYTDAINLPKNLKALIRKTALIETLSLVLSEKVHKLNNKRKF